MPVITAFVGCSVHAGADLGSAAWVQIWVNPRSRAGLCVLIPEIRQISWAERCGRQRQREKTDLVAAKALSFYLCLCCVNGINSFYS